MADIIVNNGISFQAQISDNSSAACLVATASPRGSTTPPGRHANTAPISWQETPRQPATFPPRCTPERARRTPAAGNTPARTRRGGSPPPPTGTPEPRAARRAEEPGAAGDEHAFPIGDFFHWLVSRRARGASRVFPCFAVHSFGLAARARRKQSISMLRRPFLRS